MQNNLTEAVSQQTENPPSRQQRKEDRQIVTPYAFEVAQDLWGTPLASPLKRAVAMTFDLLLVAMLTTLHSLVFAAFAAWTFFRAGNRLKQKKRFNAARILLRFIAASLIFVIAYQIIDPIFSESSSGDSVEKTSAVEAGLSGLQLIENMGLGAKYIGKLAAIQTRQEKGECMTLESCWQPLGLEIAEALAGTQISDTGAEELFEDIISTDSTRLTQKEVDQLLQHVQQRFAEVRTQQVQTDENTAELTEPQADKSVLVEPETLPKVEPEASKVGVMAWLTSIADDLGLGFGWAAFYFSVFTAWWQGQTPGKRLVGIKVVQLDGSGLNLWLSFERYGGYGAGLATGLLGFLQLLWDANRQAIQDKISETLVIDIRKAKRQWHVGK